MIKPTHPELPQHPSPGGSLLADMCLLAGRTCPPTLQVVPTVEIRGHLSWVWAKIKPSEHRSFRPWLHVPGQADPFGAKPPTRFFSGEVRIRVPTFCLIRLF